MSFFPWSDEKAYVEAAKQARVNLQERLNEAEAYRRNLVRRINLNVDTTEVLQKELRRVEHLADSLRDELETPTK